MEMVHLLTTQAITVLLITCLLFLLRSLEGHGKKGSGRHFDTFTGAGLHVVIIRCQREMQRSLILGASVDLSVTNRELKHSHSWDSEGVTDCDQKEHCVMETGLDLVLLTCPKLACFESNKLM